MKITGRKATTSQRAIQTPEMCVPLHAQQRKGLSHVRRREAQPILEFCPAPLCADRGSANLNKGPKVPTPRQVKQALRSLERKGIIEKKRDALGNIVTRPGNDGRPQVVWVATYWKRLH